MGAAFEHLLLSCPRLLCWRSGPWCPCSKEEPKLPVVVAHRYCPYNSSRCWKALLPGAFSPCSVVPSPLHPTGAAWAQRIESIGMDFVIFCYSRKLFEFLGLTLTTIVTKPDILTAAGWGPACLGRRACCNLYGEREKGRPYLSAQLIPQYLAQSIPQIFTSLPSLPLPPHWLSPALPVLQNWPSSFQDNSQFSSTAGGPQLSFGCTSASFSNYMWTPEIYFWNCTSDKWRPVGFFDFFFLCTIVPSIITLEVRDRKKII